ncbi:MAG: hypothetical protein ACOYL3_16295 [Desulfuromonadaceae bacterium]
MGKIPHKMDQGASMQQQLFDNGMEEGALDIDLGHRQCLSRAMSACGKDRYQIASEMSRLMATTVSKEMLDKYAASDPHNGMRAVMQTAFCFVTGTYEPFHYLLDPLGAEVVTAGDMKFLKLARLEEQRRKLEHEIQIVRSQCGIK